MYFVDVPQNVIINKEEKRMKKFIQKLIDSSAFGLLGVIEGLSISLLSVLMSIFIIVVIIEEIASL